MTEVLESTISRNEVLLVGGPAAVKLVSGEIEILGWKLAQDKIIVIRRGKVVPIETPSNAKINIKTQSKLITKTEKNRAGTSLWKEYLSNLNLKNYRKILILGSTDSGKTTLSTFLANYYIFQIGLIGILDSDVGQNDLVPPGYIGLSVLKYPVIDLRDIEPNYIRYYGDIKPSTNPTRLNEIIYKLSMQIKSHFIINTDGFVEGEGLEIKRKLIDKIKPDLVISLGVKVNDIPNLIVLPPFKGITKTKIDRRERRELQYLSFLQRMRYKLVIDLLKIPTYIFGTKIKLKILRNRKYGSFLIGNRVGKIGDKDLVGLFISLEDKGGKEHIGWIKNYDGQRIIVSTLNNITPHQIQKIHLGLVRYDGREEILNFLKGICSTEDMMTFSFNQNGIIE